jgi:hypothetical protein
MCEACFARDWLLPADAPYNIVVKAQRRMHALEEENMQLLNDLSECERSRDDGT